MPSLFKNSFRLRWWLDYIGIRLRLLCFTCLLELHATARNIAAMGKFGNKPIQIDGLRFASKAEGRRYNQLKLLQQAGQIQNLKCQVPFQLTVNSVPICKYIADFTYTENDNFVVEDVKGMRSGVAYNLFQIKANLMYATRGIKVQVWPRLWNDQ